MPNFTSVLGITREHERPLQEQFFTIAISGVITSDDIADSLVMKEMDDNRGLMMIHDASH